MPLSNRLSIFLVKEEITEDTDIIQFYSTYLDLSEIGRVYIADSQNSTPKWVSTFFANRINGGSIFTANARAVLLVRVPVEQGRVTRIFAITLGYGKNLLCDGVVEERFGLKVILNTIAPNSLRKINKINIGGNQKQSTEQLPLKSEINEFGFDVFRDLISSISGVSEDDEYVSGILSGSDILSLTTNVDISNIKDFLVKTYQKYRLTKYRENFEWIDQIQYVKDSQTKELLDIELLHAIQNNSPTVWMAVPEVISWEEILGFKYHGHVIHDDIYISEFKASFRKPLDSIDQFKSRTIFAIDSRDDSVRYSWNAYKCLLGEVTLNGSSYCLNNSKWYKVDNGYVALINQDYASTEISQIDFLDYTAEFLTEGNYNEKYETQNPDQYLCMDQKVIMHGGGHSSIELCDILSKDKQLIHIKKYTSSAVLSHLFNQAAVSAELMLSDNDFLAKARQKIAELSDEEAFSINDERQISIVFGIISKGDNPLPSIPFFSKVAFRYTKSRLTAFGLSVSIKAIKDLK